MNFIRHLAEEQRKSIMRVNSLLETDARRRFMNTIYTLARNGDSDWHTIHPSITQEDIANMARLSRSTATIIINELRREGVLGGSGRALKVNVPRLQSLINSHPGRHHTGV
ncbi:MAG: helix-turn-helix domain-containing protein [Chloroflexi bacterium]|nr:helix-turn-helix domain-containing protein [Chloroflexota bacterium]